MLFHQREYVRYCNQIWLPITKWISNPMLLKSLNVNYTILDVNCANAPLVAILVRFLPVVLATSNPQSLYTSKSSQQFLVSLIHSITGENAVWYPFGHFDVEIFSPWNWAPPKLSGESYLTLFPLTFGPLESQLPLTTTMHKIFGYRLPHIYISRSEQ